MRTPPPVSSDPLRELTDEQIDTAEKAYAAHAVPAWTSNRHRPALAAAIRATLTTIPSATEPALRSALERVTWCFRLLLSGKPVRDAAETLAEADAALSSRATEPDRNAAKWRGMLEDVMREMPDRVHHGDRGNAPGHGHDKPGIWDSDNGKLAGKPCAWCLVWNEARAAIATR